MTTKSISIKDAGGKSGGRVSKAVELIAGELLHCLEFVTEGGVIHPDPAAAVSSGRSTHASEEVPNSKSGIAPANQPRLSFTGSEDGEAETETGRAAKPLWRTTTRISRP
jgi:hypothetical protein